jgi:hypothetical protein
LRFEVAGAVQPAPAHCLREVADRLRAFGVAVEIAHFRTVFRPACNGKPSAAFYAQEDKPMWIGIRIWLSRMIGGIRPLLGHTVLMLFVMIGMVMGGIYIFGRLIQIRRAGRRREGPLPRPNTDLQYPRPRKSWTASAPERQKSIESVE